MNISITTSTDPQTLRWAQAEHVVITITMADNGAIAPDDTGTGTEDTGTYAFTVATKSGTRVFQKTSTSGSIEITSNGGPTSPGVVTVTLTVNSTILTLPEDSLEWDFWKTNGGEETKLAHGDVEVGKQLYR